MFHRLNIIGDIFWIALHERKPQIRPYPLFKPLKVVSSIGPIDRPNYQN
jgi:hypothetical protein